MEHLTGRPAVSVKRAPRRATRAPAFVAEDPMTALAQAGVPSATISSLATAASDSLSRTCTFATTV